MSNGQAIRIDDLRSPNYSKIQQAALDIEPQLKVNLSTEAVLDAALAKADGLKDFGAEDFIKRLEVQIQSVSEDPNLNNLGALGVFNEWVLYAENRLRLIRLWQDYPQIERETIDSPVIIAGLPRSGTTHLVNLIASDKRFRAMPLWEARRPVATGDNTKPERTTDNPRYQLCAEEWQRMSATLPLLSVMHPMHPDHIHEEIELQCADFSTYILEWLAYVPRWRDYYFSQDQTPHYAFMKKGIQTLQWYSARERWILKSPQHLEQLPVLRKTFPDATIVVTHRDPVSVIASAATMFAYGARMRCAQVDTRAIGNYWVDRVEHLLRACVRDRDNIPAAQSVDVLFHEFMGDETGTLEKIYQTAGVDLSDTARTEHASYIAQHARNKHGQMAYRLKEYFDIDPEALRERFDFYYRRFSVRRENVI